jgi:hypothetical protein
LLCFVGNLSHAQTNIYNSDGYIDHDRTVEMRSNFLNFTGNLGTNLFIDSKNSFVGLGTLVPTVRLDVIGTIRGKNGIFQNIVDSGTNPFENQYQYLYNSHVLGAGYKMGYKIDDKQMYRFNFNVFDYQKWGDLNDDFVHVNIIDRKNIERFYFNAYAEGGEAKGQMTFGVVDKLDKEVFKLHDNGLESVFIHLPKSNSRIVIGNWGNYLPEHKFVVSDGSAMIEGNIFTNSNIGVGTQSFVDNNDNYRVSVNGAIRAHRVRVYTNWADYVFDKTYDLPTLEEVENHIVEKGHLIDIPSATEVEENGIELGEMNKLLLQKIEELTLYVIDLNKELKELKSKISN